MDSYPVALFQSAYDKNPDNKELTWDELRDLLSHHQARTVKGGPCWSPVRYRAGTTRNLENIESVSCFVMDYDSGVDPQVLIPHWMQWPWVIHSSFSSTLDEPKWRIVFPLLDEVPAAIWPETWRKLAYHLGRGYHDAVCKDATRLYFLPQHPKADSLGAFVAQNDGPDLLLLDPDTFPEPPPPPPAAVAYAAPPPDREVAVSYLLAYGEQVRRNQGRKMGAFLLACQFRDNGYTEAETMAAINGPYLASCPPTNMKGEVEAFGPRDVQDAVESAYGYPTRDAWQFKERPRPVVTGYDSTVKSAGVVSVPGLPRHDSGGGAPPPEEPPTTEGGEPEEDPRGEFLNTPTLTLLWGKEFPPLHWAVDGFLPEGFTTLVGGPKVGKSWMGLGLALPICMGGMVLGQFSCDAGEVLYLALEDSERRLQSRIQQILRQERPDPLSMERFHYRVKWPRFGTEGGLGLLDEWLTRHPETQLVVIDVLAAIRPPRGPNGDVYADDYQFTAGIHELAAQHRCAILGLHHTNKRTSDDVFMVASGSQGFAGGVDGQMTLRGRVGERTARLEVIHRELMQAHDFQVAFDPQIGTWAIQTDNGTPHIPRRDAVLEIIREHGPITPKRLLPHTQLNSLKTLETHLRRLRDAELVVSDGGMYRVAGAGPEEEDAT